MNRDGTNVFADSKAVARTCVSTSARPEEYEQEVTSKSALIEVLTSPTASANIKRGRSGTLTENHRNVRT